MSNRPRTALSLALSGPLLATALASPLAASETLWVSVVNWTTGDVIYDVRIAPDHGGQWSANMAGPDAVFAGEEMYIPVRITDTCYFDVRVESDWTVTEFDSVNLCDASAIFFDDFGAWVEFYEMGAYETGH